jgi:uncharacterized membrane protein
MPSSSDEILSLRELVAQLTQRVYRLEQAARSSGIVLEQEPAPHVAPAPPPVAAAPPFVPLEPPPIAALESVPPEPPGRGLESTIGSQWLNRIGIAAVLIGVSFFLK